jgi:hypothetical protein
MPHRRPHGWSHVPDRDGQEDAWEVNENMRGVRREPITFGDQIGLGFARILFAAF